MTPAIPLPDWIEQPVPQYELDPVHDAIGKFVRAVKGMEIWISVNYTRFGFTDVRAPLGHQVKDLASRADLVPESDRPEFMQAMADALEIIEIRNGVIHGVGFPDETETMFSTVRPDRSTKGAKPGRRIVHYDRPLLIGAGLRANAIGGFLQVHASR